MEYKRLDTAGYQQLMQKYHVGSLLAKVVSSFRCSEEEQDSFFHARSYRRLEHESFRQLEKLLQQAKGDGNTLLASYSKALDGTLKAAPAAEAGKNGPQRDAVKEGEAAGIQLGGK